MADHPTQHGSHGSAGLGIDACAIALHSEQAGSSNEAWIHLLPAGTFSGRDGRGPYRAGNADAIMAASRQLAGRTKMPVDYNHAIDFAAPKGGASPAAGWISALQSRADGIWGRVEWTAQAAKHLAEREYRYLSPAFAHTPTGEVTAILRASLVNYPNLTQLVALASAEMTMSETTTGADDPRQTLTAIRSLLGLPADADAVAITGAIGQLRSDAVSTHAPDPSQFVPIGEYVRVTQELNRVHQGIEAHAAKDHVEAQIKNGKLLPFMKDWAISLCTVNKPAFDKFLGETSSGIQRILDPSAASRGLPPSSSQASSLADTDAHVAKLLGHSVKSFNEARG